MSDQSIAASNGFRYTTADKSINPDLTQYKNLDIYPEMTDIRQNIFNKYDTDGNGILDQTEAANVKLPNSSGESRSLFDIDGDGTINSDEYSFFSGLDKTDGISQDELAAACIQLDSCDQQPDEQNDGVIQADAYNHLDLTHLDTTYNNIKDWKNNTSGYNGTNERSPFVLRVDGKISDPISQGEKEGDCWAVAGIRALANTNYGSKAIRDAINVNTDNGDVTVTLKGTGEQFTYTPDQIKSRYTSDSQNGLATGDPDARVLEMAIEDHRRNVIQNGTATHDNQYSAGYNPATYVGDGTLDDPLSGGWADQVPYLLTGQDPTLVDHATANYDAVNFGFNPALDDLNKIKDDPTKYSGTASFQSKDTATGIITDHSYTIKRVDDNNVVVTNPWDTSQEITYSKTDFLNNYDNMILFDESQDPDAPVTQTTGI